MTNFQSIGWSDPFPGLIPQGKQPDLIQGSINIQNQLKLAKK